MKARELKAMALYIDDMRKIERQVHRLNELDCNFGLTPRQEKRRDKLENQYKDIAASQFMLFTEVQRDPRGGAMKLHDPESQMDSSTGVML